ncbi:winged helix-turn-helix domain-containing protein [Rubinisphaera margarita]|uniref:winged helix-turn-helix domain-containing protein n=1 Tax=Rubinisphaera margarita TaxID=2909586 RepID=UPI001EE7909E|nr:winged helix-turn-helix domain-containing protein [Rubinisphaera margarita]MCG6158336.1 winged helix-turn-helix domain-containing protein [Rubinisphaera margarita]
MATKKKTARKTAAPKTDAQAPEPKTTRKPRTRRMAEKAKGTTTLAKKADKPKAKLSLLDAAHQILKDAGQPMACKAIVEAAATQGLWSSPAGKTPHNTLYAAMMREINTRGDNARFTKVERGQFQAR